MKNSNTCFLIISILMVAQTLFLPHLFGQISGPVFVKIDTVAKPNIGNFTSFSKQGNLLFGFAKNDEKVFSSTDDGENWSLFLPNIRQFEATDSFIFYQNTGGTYWKINPQGTLDSLWQASWYQQISQQTDPWPHYYWLHENFPFKKQNKNIVSHFGQSSLYRTNGIGQPASNGIYTRSFQLSTDGGKTFLRINLDGAQSTQSINQPSYFVHGDSMLIFDLNHLYKVSILTPINGLAGGSHEIGAFSAWQPTLTWAKNCMTIWATPGQIAQYYDENFGPIRSRTFDDGATWQRDTLPLRFARAQISMTDTFTYLACPTGLYRSTDFRADSFVLINQAIPNEAGISIFNPFFDSQNIYASSASGAVLHSPDDGQHWSVKHRGMPKNVRPRYFEMDGKLHLIAEKALFQWSEDSLSWLPRAGWTPSGKILRFGGQLWTPSETTVFRSQDEGRTWEPNFKGIGTVTDIFANSNRIYATNGGNLYFTSDTGQVWQLLPLNLTSGQSIHWPVFLGDTLYYYNWAGPNLFGVFRSTDGGTTAQIVFSTTLEAANLLVMPGHNLLIVLKNGSVFHSNNSGESWSQTGQAIFDETNPTGFTSFVADSLLCFWKWDKPIFSTNFGVEWVEIKYSNYDNFPIAVGGWIYQGFERLKISTIRDSVAAISGRTGIFSGRLVIDQMADCQADATASPLSGKILEITPGPRLVQTDLEGNFSILLPAGNYHLKTSSLRNHLVCPDTLIQNISIKPDSTTVQLLDFQAIEDIVDGAAMFEEKEAGGWSIFPNPADQVLYIFKEKNTTFAAANFTVFNLMGQAVLEKSLPENGTVEKLDLSGLPSGQYFLKISKPEKPSERFLFKKLVIRHLD